MTVEAGDATPRATQAGVAEHSQIIARSRLVSASSTPHFEFAHVKSAVKTGPERLYRSNAAWFTRAAFKRRDGFDVVVSGRFGVSYFEARQALGELRFGGC
jgi:hypothetical protein